VLEYALLRQQQATDPDKSPDPNPFHAFTERVPLQLIIHPRELPDIPGRPNQLGVAYTPGINLTRPTAVRLTIPSENVVYLRHVPQTKGDASIIGFVVDDNVDVEVQTGEQPTSRKVDRRLESFYSSQYHSWKEEAGPAERDALNPRQSIHWQPLSQDQKTKVLATWLGNLQDHVPIIAKDQLKPGAQLIAPTGGAFPSPSPFHSAPNVTTATYDPSELREEVRERALRAFGLSPKTPVLSITMRGWTSGQGQSGSPLFVRLKDGRLGLAGFTSQFNNSMMLEEIEQWNKKFESMVGSLEKDLALAKTPEERARLMQLKNDYEELAMHIAQNIVAKYMPLNYMSSDPARKQMFRLHQQQVFSYGRPYFKLPTISEPPSVLYVYPFEVPLSPDEQQEYMRNVANAVQRYMQRGRVFGPLEDDTWERHVHPTKVTVPADKPPPPSIDKPLPPGDGGGLKAIPGAIKGISEKLPGRIQKPPPGNK
jgi:hypothetical protein